MKTELISREEIDAVQAANKCGVQAALEIIAPWASRFARVQDDANKTGYMAFESVPDYENWKKQK